MRMCQMNSRPKDKPKKDKPKMGAILIPIEKRQLKWLEGQFNKYGISYAKSIRKALDKEIKRYELLKWYILCKR